MKVLSTEQIQTFLEQQPSWSLSGGMLVREWTFKDFTEAMAFVNRAASLAEAADHHPDIDIRYNRVRLGLTTHDAGGVSRRDLSLAEALEK